jgi:Ca-activated chloride channel family protein
MLGKMNVNQGKDMTILDWKRILFILLFAFPVITTLTAQTAHQNRRDADKKYTQGLYNEAEEAYRKSLEKDPVMKGHFNLGNSLYQQQRYEEAIEQYDKAIARTDEAEVLNKAYYNKGNSYFGEQKLKESIDSYKQALRYDPNDKEAMQNLLLTKQLLRQQQQQQQQQEQNQNQENQQDQQEQDQQEQGEENQEKEQENPEQENGQSEEEQEQEPQQDQPQAGPDSTLLDSLKQMNVTREELMKLLKAIEDEDKQIQQKLRRGSVKNKKSEKDW